MQAGDEFKDKMFSLHTMTYYYDGEVQNISRKKPRGALKTIGNILSNPH